jgi:hypothetical protein
MLPFATHYILYYSGRPLITGKNRFLAFLPAFPAFPQERTLSLLYIEPLYTSLELFQLKVAPLVLEIGIHQGQTGRKGVSRREEDGKSGRV